MLKIHLHKTFGYFSATSYKIAQGKTCKVLCAWIQNPCVQENRLPYKKFGMWGIVLYPLKQSFNSKHLRIGNNSSQKYRFLYAQLFIQNWYAQYKFLQPTIYWHFAIDAKCGLILLAC